MDRDLRSNELPNSLYARIAAQLGKMYERILPEVEEVVTNQHPSESAACVLTHSSETIYVRHTS